MASLTLRSVKALPLTNTEIDNNFINLNDELSLKLDATDYNAADVLTKLKTVHGQGSGLDADMLDGMSADSTNSFDTIVSRDSSGNFAAATITASFNGDLTGNVTGNVVGNVTGDITGDVTGDVLGNVVGNVFGDLSGNVVGNVLGKVGNITPDTGSFTTITASGLVSLLSSLEVDGTVTLNGPLVTAGAGAGTSGQILLSTGGTSAPQWSNFIVNLSTQSTGILQPSNGGTGISSPGASGNVLTSEGGSWVSSPLNILDGYIGASKLSGNQSGAAPIFGNRAWVNFNGADFDGSGNCTIRGNGNILSVVRSSAGKYLITLDEALANTNFAVIGTGSATTTSSSTNGVTVSHYSSPTSNSFLIEVTDAGSNIHVDAQIINLIVIG